MIALGIALILIGVAIGVVSIRGMRRREAALKRALDEERNETLIRYASQQSFSAWPFPVKAKERKP